MSAKEQAQAAKNRGNTAFAKGEFDTAVTEFSAAIELDPTDNVFFSNRSGAYASLSQFDKALEDANTCISLKPNWGKGYSRKGFALLKLRKFDEATAAYNEGLAVEPGNASCTQGLKDVEDAQKPANPLGSLFGPDMWGKLAADPVTREYLNDPAFVQKLKQIQSNPNGINEALSGKDKRMSAALGVILGLGSSGFSSASPGDLPDEPMGQAEEDGPVRMHTEEKKSEPAKEEDGPFFEEEEVDPELEAEKQKKKQAAEFKDKGNELYKKKEFGPALEMYEKAIELDPDNISFQTNKAAVFFEQKEYEACEKLCNDAIEAAKSRKGYDYKTVAKAYFRMGNAQDKLGKISEAMESYRKAQLEDPLPAAATAYKKLEARKKKMEQDAYLDPVKSEEAKNRGNEYFKDGKWSEAIAEYSEALARDPSNYRVYSNRAACYTKLMDWSHGLEDCDKCLAIDPKFVKAYIRKGKIQHFLKQYHKALETFQRGLDLDPTATELIEGKRMTMAAINAENASGSVDPARAQEAMKDPEIQAILHDPMINKVLKDMQSDPASGQRAMADAGIRSKIEKLIAAGILQVGR